MNKNRIISVILARSDEELTTAIDNLSDSDRVNLLASVMRILNAADGTPSRSLQIFLEAAESMPKDEQKKMIAESMKVLPSADIDWVEISKAGGD